MTLHYLHMQPPHLILVSFESDKPILIDVSSPKYYSFHTLLENPGGVLIRAKFVGSLP
jgi:hypothetical protein